MALTQTKSRAGSERAQRKRDQAERLLREADAIEQNDRARRERSDAEILEGLNSWDSYKRRIGGNARQLDNLHNTAMYGHAMKLYRYLARICKDEAKEIDFDRLTRHMKLKDKPSSSASRSYVRNLLALLKGTAVKVQEFPQSRRTNWQIAGKRGEKLLPGFPPNEHGQPIVTVKPATGRHKNVYGLAPPPQFEFIWEAEEAGLLE